MSDAPSSPRAARLQAPSWLDGRLVLGLLLVLVSVLVGARVLASADRTEVVWAAATDLAPGAVLAAEDLEAQRVRLDGARVAYLDAAQQPPVGWVVQRGLLAGELVPQRALKAPDLVELRQVTVSVGSGHAPPDLRADDLVDVWVTPEADVATTEATQPGGSQVPGPQRVLARVAVASVPEAGGFGGSAETRAVVLNVRPDDVPLLVAAAGSGTVDLVRLPVDGLARPDAVKAAG